jgi:SAM-dependent methyltransferase
MSIADARLADTRRAFDLVANDYDGPSGNNEIVQLMRAALRREVIARRPSPARLLDLGCGTGLDAAFFAQRGYDVVATDWSPAMVDRAQARLNQNGLDRRARAGVLGVQELDLLTDGGFDLIYSNLGALNCVPDLRLASGQCARLLRPGGQLVFSVIGRTCPWESAYFSIRGDRSGARRRSSPDAVPVGLAGQTVWTTYFNPGEFFTRFSKEFRLTSYRSLALTLPPPYLIGIYRRLGPVGPLLDRFDSVFGRLPGLRNLGDHFLMVMTKLAEPAGHS